MTRVVGQVLPGYGLLRAFGSPRKDGHSECRWRSLPGLVVKSELISSGRASRLPSYCGRFAQQRNVPSWTIRRGPACLPAGGLIISCLLSSGKAWQVGRSWGQVVGSKANNNPTWKRPSGQQVGFPAARRGKRPASRCHLHHRPSPTSVLR